MSIANRLLTYDDLLQAPDDLRRYEIIEGAWFVTPAPGAHHQGIQASLMLLVGNWVVPRDLSKVYSAPFDVILSEHNIVEPDLLFIRKERLGIVTGRYVDGAPDLVVEILSPSTREMDTGRKAERYAAAGVPEYWLADPLTKTFTLLALRNGRYEPAPMDNGKLRSVVLPGLVIEVASLFADLVP